MQVQGQDKLSPVFLLCFQVASPSLQLLTQVLISTEHEERKALKESNHSAFTPDKQAESNQ